MRDRKQLHEFNAWQHVYRDAIRRGLLQTHPNLERQESGEMVSHGGPHPVNLRGSLLFGILLRRSKGLTRQIVQRRRLRPRLQLGHGGSELLPCPRAGKCSTVLSPIPIRVSVLQFAAAVEQCTISSQ